jgi:hypothetical protein
MLLSGGTTKNIQSAPIREEESSDVETATEEWVRRIAVGTAQVVGSNMLQPQLSVIGASVKLARKSNSSDWHSVVT